VADTLQVGTAVIKRRDPWGVIGLTLITLGIYHAVWYYKINTELANYQKARVKVTPWIAVIALVFTPFGFISGMCTAVRVRHAQTGSGAPQRINLWTTFFIGFIGLYSVYVQSQLNKAWDVEFAAVGQ